MEGQGNKHRWFHGGMGGRKGDSVDAPLSKEIVRQTYDNAKEFGGSAAVISRSFS